MKLRPIVLLLPLLLAIGLLAYCIEIYFPATPNVNNTFTPLIAPTPQEIGSYDVLGTAVSKAEAQDLLTTEEGKTQLASANGAVEITQDLIDRGRQAFYSETFGDEIFQSDVVGALDGVLNVKNLTKAILRLGGKPTTNLQVPIDRDITLGGRTFAKGTLLNTGLDVPAYALTPLGMRVSVGQGQVRAGITCALCHAAVDVRSGRVLEGAPNNDVNMGLLLAAAPNSAALFRQTGVNPTKLPLGKQVYQKADGTEARLPDAEAVENAVDAQLLTWLPGNFDSTGNMVNNPSQNPSSYTHDAYPYGWSGFASIGWFHGLTTLNNNVHATNSDSTTGADSSEPLLGIDKETYLGLIFQNAAKPKYRLPQGAKPSEFFDKVDPTPGKPGMNEVIRMPGYPQGSAFMLDGLMANSPGKLVAQELNEMSAWQNTLAPPPYPASQNLETLQQGAAVFDKAGCVSCHSGRYFTNHDVISESKLKSQPSRAKALAAFPRIFTDPKTYPPNQRVPLKNDPPALNVPIDITPLKTQELAFAVDKKGGYKVPSLIGLAVTAPYLHDGGVAASADALKQDKPDRPFQVVAAQIGAAGTLMQWIPPDAAASLRVLVDRRLRNRAVAVNRANPDLKAANIDGSGHNYWVDRRAGYSVAEQNALIEFLLSLDDDPAVLPQS